MCWLSPTSPKNPTLSSCPPTPVTSAEWSHRYFLLTSCIVGVFFVCLNATKMFPRSVLIRSGDDHLQHAGKAEAKSSWGRGGGRGGEERRVAVSIAQGSPNELDKLRRSRLCFIKTLKQRTVSRVHRSSVGARVKNFFPQSHSRIFLWKISLFTNDHLCLFHVK